MIQYDTGLYFPVQCDNADMALCALRTSVTRSSLKQSSLVLLGVLAQNIVFAGEEMFILL